MTMPRTDDNQRQRGWHGQRLHSQRRPPSEGVSQCLVDDEHPDGDYESGLQQSPPEMATPVVGKLVGEDKAKLPLLPL